MTHRMIAWLVPLLLSACGGAAPTQSAAAGDIASPASLDGSAWILVDWPGHSIPQPPDGDVPTLRFEADRISGHLPCNGFSASATRTAATLTLGPMLSTKRACPALDAESAFSAALSQVATYERIGSDKLILRTADGQTLGFAAHTPQD